MTSVQSRIEQAPACTVINLTEAEKDSYSGAGWKLARFVDGHLVYLLDPLNLAYRTKEEGGVSRMIQESLDDAVAWMNEHPGEFWLVMCSCYQLCQPRRVSLTDSEAMADMARVFGEQFEEIS